LKKINGPDVASKLPEGILFTVNKIYYTIFFYTWIYFVVCPHSKCRLKLLKLERIKDYLLMEEEFIVNQEKLKPQEEKNEVNIKL